MTRLFQIHIDLGLLRNNLSREEGRDVSDAEVGGWLNVSGFKPTGDGWTVEESNLVIKWTDQYPEVKAEIEAIQSGLENTHIFLISKMVCTVINAAEKKIL